ncbi:MAG: hypothetical protein GTO51_03575 [Candidatus Latescibacteria bacterium]|nr:hypothetical protein [Candidatus Latescibacterota bacterium]NIM20919.1 hypothetical protein [Candidatus Latescibacterota bacterium]NIM65054.1 hypothetical protein [Candidatus Latescibacterota bacterium]NIO01569.1 hypothetical protein [Candidatus Latescibacterota bacterium]NIO28086.1 hypothetical protein [Candidatus Latescibacterota bacterium]
MIRLLSGRVLFVCVLFLVLIHAQSVLADTAFIRSLLLPGSGQAHKGNYGRATLFASAAVISGVGLFISQVHYNRATDKYNGAKTAYLAFGERLEHGDLLSFQEIDRTYRDMLSSLDQAKSRYKWRNFFLVALIGSYALNLADVLITQRPPEEKSTAVSLELHGDEVRIVKSLRL